MKLNLLFIPLLAFLILGCSTTYKKAGDGGRLHGWDEAKISDSKYSLRFLGRVDDPREIIHDLFMRRAADLTTQNGFRFFSVSDGKFGSDVRGMMGVTAVAPFYEGTVIFQKDQTQDSFDAQNILEKFQAKKK